MRAVIQRVREAQVTVDEQVVGKIDHGFLVLLGITSDDDGDDVEWLAQKIAALRVFSDTEGRMNLNLSDVSGKALVVSQFTLHAKYKKGNRPSFIRAAHPDHAIPLYNAFCKRLSEVIGKSVETGEFGASMDVHLVNDGPVTLMIDTKNKE